MKCFFPLALPPNLYYLLSTTHSLLYRLSLICRFHNGWILSLNVFKSFEFIKISSSPERHFLLQLKLLYFSGSSTPLYDPALLSLLPFLYQVSRASPHPPFFKKPVSYKQVFSRVPNFILYTSPLTCIFILSHLCLMISIIIFNDNNC